MKIKINTNKYINFTKNIHIFAFIRILILGWYNTIAQKLKSTRGTFTLFLVQNSDVAKPRISHIEIYIN